MQSGQPVANMVFGARSVFVSATLLALATHTSAFVDESAYPKESFSYRGYDFNVPRMPPVPGGFVWGSTNGGTDYDTYKYRCRWDNVLSLTFDDGPVENTIIALDVLQRLGAKATFCMVSFSLCLSAVWPDSERNPFNSQNTITTKAQEDIVKRMADEGHSLCLHTVNHKHLTELPDREIVDEILDNMNQFKDLIGKTPRLVCFLLHLSVLLTVELRQRRYFRPPFGEIDLRVRSIVQTLGLTVLIWNLDSFDWRLDPQISLDRLAIAMDFSTAPFVMNPLSKNVLLLAHDIHKETVENVLEQSVLMARARGWQVVSVEEEPCLGQSRWLEGESPARPATSKSATKSVTKAVSSTLATTQQTTNMMSTTTSAATTEKTTLIAAVDDFATATGTLKPQTIAPPEPNSALSASISLAIGALTLLSAFVFTMM